MILYSSNSLYMMYFNVLFFWYTYLLLYCNVELAFYDENLSGGGKNVMMMVNDIWWSYGKGMMVVNMIENVIHAHISVKASWEPVNKEIGKISILVDLTSHKFIEHVENINISAKSISASWGSWYLLLHRLHTPLYED